jgi:eukaryotic-like serine/threonine-protein kinase
MCAALARAHDLGVVHRDLKSDNIMLTTQGGRKDFVKILDFGLAALTRDARLAPKGAVFGTPEYMAPEQARGEDATAHCDLYALGILFFEMLTGQLPFRSSDRETLLEMQRSAPPPRPRNVRPEIPAQAEAIILRLLEKEAAKRFRDGHHLQEELKAFQRTLPGRAWETQQNDAPAAAPPPPPPAPTPGVQEWGTRAANYQRALARSYPNGKPPDDIQQAADVMWELASRAARLEGELASHSQKLEATEKRGRALRAEMGRKVEELAAEESRALREATDWRESARKVEGAMSEARREHEESSRRANAPDLGSADVTKLRQVFEAVGAARARIEGSQRHHDFHVAHATDKERQAGDLRKQIEELRKQLQRYSDALENDLSAGRDRIATRVKEALGFEKSFDEASTLLLAHLRDKPECRDLIEELTTGERERNAARTKQQPKTPTGDTTVGNNPV